MKKTLLFSIVLTTFFIFLRLYKLDQSLFFFNDIGRDFNTLYDWRQSGKPPLLGPQTSALPINQSAIYFYLLYPVYLITNGFFLSNTYTAILIYLLFFIFSLKLFKKYALPVFYLISIHPQLVSQTRSVWNPTFTLPFILIGIFSFNQPIIFGASMALAISFSYSTAPLLIAFLIYGLVFNRQNLLKQSLSIIFFLGLFNLPTLIFEIRHHFLLTTSLLTKNHPLQERLLPIDKLGALSTYIFSTSNQTLNILLFLFFIVLCLLLIFKHKNNYHQPLFLAPFLYLTSTLLIFILPFTIQAHYVFTFIGLLFLIISFLPPKYKYSLILIFSFIYLNPQQLNQYFAAAPRTYSQINSCVQSYCQQNIYPLFVSVNSSYHPWHYGPEFRYLMKKNGCLVKNIETENGQSHLMAVVLDNASFTPQTQYYELELFGKSKTVASFDCLPNFKITTLQKL